MLESWIPSGKFSWRESCVRKLVTLVTEITSVKHIFIQIRKIEKADGRIWKGRLEINILMARSHSDWNKQSFAIDFHESRIKYAIKSGGKRLQT